MEVVPGAALLRVGDVLHRCRTRFVAGKHISLRFLGKATSGRFPLVVDEIRWDEFYMAHSATTIDENGKHRQYAVPRRVVQRSSTLLAPESPRMSLTRDALWHNGL